MGERQRRRRRVATWQIRRLRGTLAAFIGLIDAADAVTAKERAIKQFDIRLRWRWSILNGTNFLRWRRNSAVAVHPDSGVTGAALVLSRPSNENEIQHLYRSGLRCRKLSVCILVGRNNPEASR